MVTAKVVISGGSITNFDVIDGGSGYGAEKLEFDPTFIGSPSIVAATFTSVGISSNIGDVIQVTGVLEQLQMDITELHLYYPQKQFQLLQQVEILHSYQVSLHLI